jgi:hypothetical protein
MMKLSSAGALLLTACVGTEISPPPPPANSGGGGGGLVIQAGGGGGSASVGGGGTGSTTGFPCEVATVLQGTCQSCHGATLMNGAPIHLISGEDLLAPSAIDSEMTVGQRCVLRMRAMAPGNMPPPPQQAMDLSLVNAFDAWVQAGLPMTGCSGAGGGTGTDAGSPPADGGSTFESDPPAVYVAKVKDVLVGLPPTDAEIAAVTADPNALAGLVATWQQLPQYQTKMLRFFQLSFQQTQITAADLGNMLDTGQLQLQSNPLLQNLQESFARTVLAQNAAGKPFNSAMTTQTFMMTTALQMFYALTDVWQMDNSGTGIHDAFKTANPSVNLVVGTSSGPIPLSQTVDPASPNFMHWYDPTLATACGMDPFTTPARANTLYDILIGIPSGCNGKRSTGQLTASDFSDWKPVTVRPPHTGEKPTWFYDLATLRSPAQTELLLNRPYVGFFTTPAFFANWQTNASNQMRVTMNQTFIVATGTQVDGTDTFVPSMTPGLDAAHANQAACTYCHQTLDPSRSIFSATFSWNFGMQFDPTWSAQKGLFAYRGVQAPVSTVYDLGAALSTHPLLAPGWVQKLCYYVNSQACEESDPEYQRLVALFQSGYSWDGLVKALVTSPLTTHAAPTLTTVQDGVAIAVARRDHLCAQWNARLGFADICGLDITKTSPLSGTARQIVPGLPSDGYARGGVAPVLPNDPTLFYRAGLENLCEGLAALVIDNASPPPGAKTWSSTQPTVAITDFVNLVAGLPPSDPRASPLSTLLTAHFNTTKAMTGITPKAALQSTFVAACMSPTAAALGL